MQDEYLFKQSKGKVYMAPEFVGQKNHQPTEAGDVYAYAIILVEIGTREDPYGVSRGDEEKKGSGGRYFCIKK